MEDIVTEAKELAAQGYTELTLLGQNVNSWGLEKLGIGFRKLLLSRENYSREDIPENQSQYLPPQGIPPFVRLLQEISAIDGIEIIRFMTSNPWDFHDELVEELARNPKLDKFMHLPVQSGSDAVLYRMNRGYTRQNYLDLITKLKTKVPGVEFGTDLIVGFPGETEEEFQQTVELAQQVGWKIGFIAMYSPRPGTAAWRIYPDDVPHQEKKRRWQILEDVINKPHLTNRPKITK